MQYYDTKKASHEQLIWSTLQFVLKKHQEWSRIFRYLPTEFYGIYGGFDALASDGHLKQAD